MPRTIYDKNKKLWKGTNTPAVYNPKVSLGQVILRVCKNFGPKIAQVTTKINFHTIRTILCN